MTSPPSSMTASAVMTSRPVVLLIDDTVATAAKHMIRNRYRNMPVVDKDGRYVGTFSVGCLLRISLPKAVTLEAGLTTAPYVIDSLEHMGARMTAAGDHLVKDYMSREGRVVHPDTPLMETLLALYQTRISLAVVEPESGRLVGVVSYWEVLDKVAGGLLK